MTVSSDTKYKLSNAVERLATGDGTAADRAKEALSELHGIANDEFAESIAQVLWHYISTTADAVRKGSADQHEARKFNLAIWQLFEAYRPR